MIFTNAVGPSGVLGRSAFVQVCQETLQIELSEVELLRIFDNVAAEGVKGLDCDSFRRTVRQRFFLRGLRRLTMESQKPSELPQGYSLDLDTAANYHLEGEGFYGPFRHIRATRDHDYHGRFSRARQKWQDGVLESVVQRTVEQPIPWLVFTCGAMGVGKGYALGWMSCEKIFPLENIVHIDPDHFKQVMPEWKAYIEYGQRLADPSVPGSRCHRESCYLQEIALEESMRRSQNIWVDGSLRNAEWFAKVFEDVRERYPAYRIAIFHVTAPEAIIRQRVKSRAERTGRAIPEDLLMESIGAVERSVAVLWPLSDFLAHIDTGTDVPQLRYFSNIDRSGDWSFLRARFANHVCAGPEDFPEALAPMYVSPVPRAVLRLSGPLRTLADGEMQSQWGVLEIAGRTFDVRLSPAATPTLRGESRVLALVPRGTASFVWMYPAVDVLARLEQPPSMLGESEAHLLTTGGFVNFGVKENVLAINAVTSTAARGEPQSPALLRFNDGIELSRPEAAAIHASRWAAVTVPHMQARGARRFAFLMPGEKLAGSRVSVSGGFVYELLPSQVDQDLMKHVFFPVKISLVED